MTRWHSSIIVAGALALGIGAAACGGDDDGGSAAADDAATDGSASPGESGDGDEATAAGAPKPGDDWNDVVAAAEEEGSALLYSVVVPDINTRLEKAFEEAYPEIDLQIIRSVSGEIDANLDAEKTTGAEGGDVVLHVNYPWVEAAQKNGDLVEPVGPNATGKQWRRFMVDKTTQISTFTMIGLAHNTDALDEGPTSFEDLLDPEYAGGKIGLPDPAAPVVADFYATLQDIMGDDFLDKLAAQDPVFYPSVVPIEQALAAGEVDVAGYATLPGISGLTEQGAPVEFTLPEGGWASPIWTYIPKWSKHPNAAQVVYDFFASPEGQEALGKDSISPLADVPGTFASVDKVTVADVDRITDPEWFNPYYTDWKSTFGR